MGPARGALIGGAGCAIIAELETLGRSARTVQITVNGESRSVEAGVTVLELVEALGVSARGIAVEVNREIVPRSLHEKTELADGDVVEVVTLVGGG